jgi:pyruvate,water dikinase
MNKKHIVDLSEVQLSDLELVGGKNASLGEMIQNLGKLGVNIPGGFALLWRLIGNLYTLIN